jgi:diaminopimelate decarboxylase
MLWPITTGINAAGHLAIDGVDLVDLAREYGTPLYVYDEATIRERCRQHAAAFAKHYPQGRVVYAGKAYLSPSILAILKEEETWLDVCSGGELGLALRCGFPAERIIFHGNNKSPEELRLGIATGLGVVVVDNLLELERIIAIGDELGKRTPIALRLNPGVEAHTHAYRQTGLVDSKFGFPTVDDQAERAVALALASPSVELRGFHAHIGAHIFELDPYRAAIRVLCNFAAQMRDRHGYVASEISPGGGIAISYMPNEEDKETPLDELGWMIGQTLRACAAEHNLPEPGTWIEPGRGLVGQAGVVLYTVGAIKDIPGIRRYIAVDGGMGDNIRPALYEAEYIAALAARPRGYNIPGAQPLDGDLTNSRIVGKFCESGDFLIREIMMPEVAPGDILAMPAAGAYHLMMASNYNLVYRPAVVFIRDGQPRLVRRRETLDDLIAAEIM